MIFIMKRRLLFHSTGTCTRRRQNVTVFIFYSVSSASISTVSPFIF